MKEKEINVRQGLEVISRWKAKWWPSFCLRAFICLLVVVLMHPDTRLGNKRGFTAEQKHRNIK
jgi:hypothetical protein